MTVTLVGRYAGSRNIQAQRRGNLPRLRTAYVQRVGQSIGRNVTGSGALGPGAGFVAFARASGATSLRAAGAAICDAARAPLLAVPARAPTSGPSAMVPLIPTRSSVITTLSLPLRFQAARIAVPVAPDRTVALLLPTAGPESTTTTSGNGWSTHTAPPWELSKL